MTARRRSVLSATRAELVAAGKLESALGSAALKLAERLDANGDPGSAMAAMAKELRTLLESVTRGEVSGDEVDELRARREARRRASAG